MEREPEGSVEHSAAAALGESGRDNAVVRCKDRSDDSEVEQVERARVDTSRESNVFSGLVINAL